MLHFVLAQALCSARLTGLIFGQQQKAGYLCAGSITNSLMRRLSRSSGGIGEMSVVMLVPSGFIVWMPMYPK